MEQSLRDKTRLRQLESGRRRGWLIYLLYEARPTPVSFNLLWQLLDARNMPLTLRQFAEKLEYLNSIGFLRVFNSGETRELSRPEQARLIQAYCDMDGEGGDHYCAALSVAGVDFHEGHRDCDGVVRVS